MLAQRIATLLVVPQLQRFFGACGDERWRTAAPEQPEMFPSDQQAGKISPGQELWTFAPAPPNS